jgi:hypothetical protein
MLLNVADDSCWLACSDEDPPPFSTESSTHLEWIVAHFTDHNLFTFTCRILVPYPVPYPVSVSTVYILPSICTFDPLRSSRRALHRTLIGLPDVLHAIQPQLRSLTSDALLNTVIDSGEYTPIVDGRKVKIITLRHIISPAFFSRSALAADNMSCTTTLLTESHEEPVLGRTSGSERMPQAAMRRRRHSSYHPHHWATDAENIPVMVCSL